MKGIELLAPAGSLESLYAAINKGCDAVYMGGSKFSARAYASNFTNEDLEKAVDYAHLYGVKIYIALNTLIKEEEILEAFEYIRFLYSIGVDALIVQDLGVAEILKTYFKDFEIHASTQMTIHNGEGAIFFKNNGFQRIVLSRELTLKDIEYISKDLGIETEIFVHGALCVCYSGQCLMSSLIGGRSGNRGRCAQPCRLPYTLINKNTREESKGYLLSPKDICNIENVEDLIESGTASLKIEGRMKRPEYVAGVVESYKKAVDSYYKKNSLNKEKEKKKLLQLFNREGFSKAYLYGNKGKDMMAYSFPKNTGVHIGTVLKDNTIVLEEAIFVGDGIRNGEEGFSVSKILVNNKEVSSGNKGDRVIIHPTNYKRGEKLYKTLDNNLMKTYESSYLSPYGKKITLKAKVDFKVNEEITITIYFHGNKFYTKGEIVQVAKNKPLSKERIIDSLQKSGDTPFKIEEIIFNTYEDGFLPVSSLNAVRREIIEAIESSMINTYKKESIKRELEGLRKEKIGKLPYLLVNVSTKTQLNKVLELNVEDIGVNIFYRGNQYLKEDDLKNIKGKRLYFKIPNIVKEEFNKVASIIERNLENIEGIITSNLGIINSFKDKTRIIGDYKLNLYNSYATEYMKPHIDGACISLELNKKEMNKLASKSTMDLQVLLYGNPELMVSEYCPIGSVMGGRDSSHNCSMPCVKGDFTLRDRKNQEFIVNTDVFCRSYIYNNNSINLIPMMKEINNVSSFRIDFINEDEREVEKVITSFKEGKWDHSYENYTRGHYKRGVE